MVITDRQLLKACCTALYLWEFGDDSVKEEKRLSDKDLIKYFAGEWNELLQVNKQIDYSDECTIS